MLNIVRIKDVINVFGIGDENLWAQDQALWYATVQVEDVWWCAIDVDDLGSVEQIWGKPGKSWVGDAETMRKKHEEQLMVHRIEGGGQV